MSYSRPVNLSPEGIGKDFENYRASEENQVNFIVTQPKSSAPHSLAPGNENYRSLKTKKNNVFYPHLRPHLLRWFGGWLRVESRILRVRPTNRMQPVTFLTICKL